NALNLPSQVAIDHDTLDLIKFDELAATMATKFHPVCLKMERRDAPILHTLGIGPLNHHEGNQYEKPTDDQCADENGRYSPPINKLLIQKENDVKQDKPNKAFV